MKLTALKYGETMLSDRMIFPDGEQEKTRRISLIVYLLEIADRRILVDAGCDTMPGFLLSHFCSPVEILAKYGLKSADITDVILTHAHHDHAEATHHFSKATVWIQKSEYEKYRDRHFSSCHDVRTFEEEIEVTKGVRIRRSGGHSAGSSVVEVAGSNQIFVLCGDECYHRDNLKLRIPTGASCCPSKSMEFIERYAAPCYRVLLAHDADLLPEQNGYLVLASEG